MTTDSKQPFLFRALKGKANAESTVVACAFSVEPTSSPVPVETLSLAWSDLLAARLRELARAAADTSKPEGKTLPYASLRAALQVQVPEALVLENDLGAPWKADGSSSFMSVEAGGSADRDPVKLAASALRTWMTMVLRPWADRLEIDEDITEAIQVLATPEAAFRTEKHKRDLGELICERDRFDVQKNAIIQVIANRLEGQELFEGLGPVYRAIGRNRRNNQITFQTWPAFAKDSRYSMTATLTVESTPYTSTPVITVRASRRRWYDTLPDAKRLSGQKTITGTMMGQQGPRVAVEFTTSVRKGVPEEPFEPEFMIHALNLRKDLATGLAEMVARTNSGVFVGLPYSPQHGGTHPVGSGATTRDLLDLFDVVTSLLANDGFKPLPFQASETNKKPPKRAAEHHKALEAEALLGDVAFSLGRNKLDGEALEEACRKLMDGVETPDIKPDAAQKAQRALQEVRAANSQRIRRAFGDTRPTVITIARTERERQLMKACIAGLFGQSVALAEYPLPDKVHQPRADLPKADGKAKERFNARVEAWAPLAETIAAEHTGGHVLVQAEDWYDRRRDDPVNKAAARHALASKANANVQYLLPRRANWRGLSNYLHRIQSAVYDLLFGHSGLVSEIASLLDGTFPSAATRPKAVIGISVVTQSRLRYGASGGRICLATRIDAQNGRTTARVGWHDKGQMRWTAKWEPLFDALKRIASPEVTASLGKGRDVERSSFQAFVRTIVDEAAREGVRPLVLIDSTSASSLWSWLTDKEIGPVITLGGERIDMAARWPDVRIVRIRTGRAGKIIERKKTRYERIDNETGKPTGEIVDRSRPTITERTIRITDGPDSRAAHYWIIGKYFQMSIPRGLSIYRDLFSFYPAKKEKDLRLPSGTMAKGLYTLREYQIAQETYRLPNSIDVTVAVSREGDDPDRIAHMVASLRCGYGHTDASTTLPAPLSFESKARDYMTRFVLDEADAADAADEEGEAASIEPAVQETEDIDLDAAESGSMDGNETLDEEDPATEPADASSSSAPSTPSAIGRSGPLPGLYANRTDDDEATDRWEALVRDFSIGRMGPGGSGRSLAMGTSLSSRIAMPFDKKTPSRSDPRSAVGRAKGTKEKNVSSKKDHSGDKALVKEESDSTAGDGQMAKTGTVTDNWSYLPKEPILPVPAFVTREWLQDKVSAKPSLLREIHKWRAEIRSLSGFPWPEKCPTEEQFLDMLLVGLRYPGFVRAVTRVAVRGAKGAKRKTQNLFIPFQRRFGNIIKDLRRKAKRQEPGDFLEDIKLLVDSHSDIALAVMYLTSHGFGCSESFKRAIEDYPDILGDLEEFVQAAMPYLHKRKFDWDTEIIKQPGAPLVPPREVMSSCAARHEEEVEEGEDEEEQAGEAGSFMTMDEDPAEPREAEPAVNEAQLQVVQQAPEQAPTGGGLSPEKEPGNKLADSDGAPPEQGSAGEVSRTAWQRALHALADRALSAADDTPDQAVIAALLSELKQARTAARAWEAAQPKYVEAEPFFVAIADMVAELAPMLGTPESTGMLYNREGVTFVSEVAAGTASELLLSCREATERAIAAEADARASAISKKPLPELQKDLVEAQRLALEAINLLSALKSLLVDGAVTPSHPKADRPQGTVGPANEATVPEAQPVPVPEVVQAHAEEVEQTYNDQAPDPIATGVVEETLTTNDGEALHAEREIPVSGELANGSDAEVVDTAGQPASEHAADDVADVDDTTWDDLGPDQDEDDLDFDEVSVGVSNVPRAEEPDIDPQALAVDRKLASLFEAREFGLAYHLLRASRRLFPQHAFGFSEPELRLTAMAGSINYAAMQGNDHLTQLTADVLESIERLKDDATISEDIAKARRLVLFGSAAGMALFQTTIDAPQILDAIKGMPSAIGEPLYPLRDAILAAAGTGILLTPAMLRAVSQEAEVGRHGDDLAQGIQEKIDFVSVMRFSFTLGNKIRAALCANKGTIGQLKDRIGRGGDVALRAADEFAKKYSHRSTIVELLTATEADVNSRVQGIDGDARERLVASFLDLAARCQEFCQVRRAAPDLKNAHSRDIVHKIRASVLTGIGEAEEALGAYATTAECDATHRLPHHPG